MPEDMAKVYSGITLQDMCQRGVKRLERQLWYRPSSTSSNHILIVKNKLEKSGL